ncbi:MULTISPECIES: hypothetical protein [unclassified Corynebacterium]|uniref:hypothetical protein n=1 Tax=unclassified Corynebacterium TaxID=2624378 RepID=UPI00352398A7
MPTSFRLSIIRSGVAVASSLALATTILVPVSVAEEAAPDTDRTVVTGPETSGDTLAVDRAGDETFTPHLRGKVTPPDDYTPPQPSGSAAQLSSGFNILNSTETLSGKSVGLSTGMGVSGVLSLGAFVMLAIVIARQSNILPRIPVDFSASAEVLGGLSSRILPQPAP